MLTVRVTHALNGHARIERSRRKVGTGGRMNTGIEEAAECHAVLHQRLAVKMEFIRVVVGVSSEQGRNSVYLCLPKIPFSGFHQCNIVTLRSKLATISIRQGLASRSAYRNSLCA